MDSTQKKEEERLIALAVALESRESVCDLRKSWNPCFEIPGFLFYRDSLQFTIVPVYLSITEFQWPLFLTKGWFHYGEFVK